MHDHATIINAATMATAPSTSLGCGLQRWVSPPTTGQVCPITGLGAAYYHNKLFKAPFVDHLVTASLRAPGQTKGKRLVWAPSLDAMLRSRADLAEGRGHGSVSRRFDLAKAAVLYGWIRIPPNGEHCDFTGLGHPMYYELLRRAGKHILVADLRLPHETRATKLIEKTSLHLHLVGLAEKQAQEGLED